MTEDKNKEKKEAPKTEKKEAPKQPSPPTKGRSVFTSIKKKEMKARKKFKRRPDRDQDEFEQRIVDIARVTRVMAGGKRMRFRACVVVGNKKGKVGYGLAKGADVTIAVTKAVNMAKKDIVEVSIVNETIPHEIYHKFKAAKVLLRPARKGKGVIAGGAARVVLELAGIKNVTSKILGTNNKVNIVKCTIEAFKNLKKVEVRKDKKTDKQKNEKRPKESKDK